MTIATEGGHWYELDGTPAYEVVGKNGNVRPTTLRDARKLNLVPSVSGICRLAPAPQLVNWQLNQVIELAADNPRGDEEGIQAYMDRIQGIFRDRGRAIMDLGSAIHGCIERHLLDELYEVEPHAQHAAAALDTLEQWCGNLATLLPEKSFAHPIGFGGKCDVHKNGFVADFKTKEFDENTLPAAWDNHAMQLAAYREGLGLTHARGAIIYVSTKVPGLTHLVEVKQDELDRGWEMFKTLLKFWQLKNKFTPAMETIADEQLTLAE